MSYDQRVSVVVPVFNKQPTELEVLSIKQCMSHLGHYPITFICPEGLEQEAYLDLVPQAVFVSFPKQYFQNVRSYSELLLTEDFYNSFSSFQYILICQTDCLIFQDTLLDWCDRGYDYVGAPWFEGFDPKNQRMMGVGNGGLSLRRVEAFQALFQWLPKHNLLRAIHPLQRALKQCIRSGAGEDLFWGMRASSYLPFKIPTIDEAIYFSFEAGLEHLYGKYTEQMPFGCHAIWNVKRLHDEMSDGEGAWDEHTRLLTELFKSNSMVKL